MGRKSMEAVLRDVRKAAELVRGGMSITQACKQVGTGVSTYHKYAEPTNADSAPAQAPVVNATDTYAAMIDRVASRVIDSQTIPTSMKLETMNAIYSEV